MRAFRVSYDFGLMCCHFFFVRGDFVRRIGDGDPLRSIFAGMRFLGGTVERSTAQMPIHVPSSRKNIDQAQL